MTPTLIRLPDADEIDRLLARGWTRARIANRFRISYTDIRKIQKGELVWKHGRASTTVAARDRRGQPLERCWQCAELVRPPCLVCFVCNNPYEDPEGVEQDA